MTIRAYNINHGYYSNISDDVKYVVLFEPSNEEVDQQSSATRLEQSIEFFTGRELRERIKDLPYVFRKATIYELTKVEVKATKRRVQRTITLYGVKPSRKVARGK